MRFYSWNYNVNLKNNVVHCFILVLKRATTPTVPFDGTVVENEELLERKLICNACITKPIIF